MEFTQELELHLRARCTLLVVVTIEEERALAAIDEVCRRSRRPCYLWTVAEGFRAVTPADAAAPVAKDPIAALEQSEQHDSDALFVLADFHEPWTNAVVRRKLRSVAQRLRFTRKALVVITPQAKLPDELRDDAVLLELPPPGPSELEAVLDRLAGSPAVPSRLTPLGREKLVQAALGLTAAQAQRVFAKAVVRDGGLDDRAIGLVTEEKKQIIRESQALEFFAVTETVDDVGGLAQLKEWLRLRERAFTQEARDYGLPAPKGLALIGIPGTGKSLTAKMIGGLWRLPLLRLDVGALFGSLVGQSEEQARRALRLAETVAPCLLWIDEVEKALASGGLDGGTSQRVFGAILTWMQEKTAPVFVVATANEVAALPPELLRRGRFDEIFFLDLPTAEERRDIFRVHLSKRRRLVADFDLDQLASASEGYVGAEIEQAVIDALVLGFNAGRELTTEDVLATLARQVPLSVSQREAVQHLRRWLHEGRAQSASYPDAAAAAAGFVPVAGGPGAPTAQR